MTDIIDSIGCLPIEPAAPKARRTRQANQTIHLAMFQPISSDQKPSRAG